MTFDQWYTLQEEKHGTPPFACSYDAARFAWQSSIQENAQQALSDMAQESVVKDSLTPKPLIAASPIKETGSNLEQDHCEDKLADRVADDGKGIADHIGDSNDMEQPAAPAASGEPAAWVVFDECGWPCHAAHSKETAHRYINNAINEAEYDEAAKWVVRPDYLAAPAEPKKCSVCGGTGCVEQYTSAGAHRVKVKCPLCSGAFKYLSVNSTDKDPVKAWGEADQHEQPAAPAAEHWSDCATNNAPAYPAGDCDCMPTNAMCRAAVEYVNGHDVYSKVPIEALMIEESIYREVWKAMQIKFPIAFHKPVAWMYQHNETGRIEFVDQWQIDNGWSELNPRLEIVTPLYKSPALRELSVHDIARLWRDSDGYLDFARAVITAAREVQK